MIKGNRKKSPVERQPETEKPIKINIRFFHLIVGSCDCWEIAPWAKTGRDRRSTKNVISNLIFSLKNKERANLQLLKRDKPPFDLYLTSEKSS